MTKRRVTLKDLAQATGFDKSTISRVLRNDPTLSIRQENIDRIKQTALQLNYVPDAAGRSLQSSRSFTIGALIPSLQNPIHAQIIEGASYACRRRGYSLIIAQAERAETQPDVLRELVERNRVDGLLALTYRGGYLGLPFDFEIPILPVNWRSDDFPNWVMVDEEPGGHLATSHLLELGHRRIAFLSGDPGRFNAAERFKGYARALAEAGIALDRTLIEEGDYSYEGGFRAMNQLLDRMAGKFSAVFVVSMLAGLGALNALKKRDIHVPEQVSVCAIHDGIIAEIVSPSLTTVFYPLTRMGELAADGIIDLIESHRVSVHEVVGDFRLVRRESTGELVVARES
jgi:LacI family transcriptional regulator